jgi:hypothetical protein
MQKTTKVMAAKQIVADNPNATRSEIVHMFIDQLGMSKAGATTYAYNLAKGAAKRVKKVVEKAVKAEKSTISKEIEVLTLVETTVLPGIPEETTAEQEEMHNEVARKLAAKRERDAARKREKRAAEKAAALAA